MRQLALEYLDFADKSLLAMGDHGLRLSDAFLEAGLDLAAARVRRFTQHHVGQSDVHGAEEKLRSAAAQLLANAAHANEVAAISLAAEKPDDPRVIEFILTLAILKL